MKMSTFQPSERVLSLPPYLFHEIDILKNEAQKGGTEVIDFGVGDPDMATPSPIIDELAREAYNGENHQYPSYSGLLAFRESICRYYARRDVSGLDPIRNVLSLIGSKEGIAHLPLAVINPGDYVLLPDPGYPVYHSGTLFAGGESFYMPLRKENAYLPSLQDIPSDVARKATLMFLNYPNNPTGAIAPLSFYEEALEFARAYSVVLCSDASYLDVCFDQYRAPSLLEVPGSLDYCIEMISLSKMFNMTGWRIGAAVGNEDVIAALGKIKMNIDSGVFNPVQYAAIYALEKLGQPDPKTMDAYFERRELMREAFDNLGWEYHKSPATFYCWVSIPRGFTSMEFTKKILETAGILATPGLGFGKNGEGFIRFSLTLPTEDVRKAVDRFHEHASELKIK